jgi:hypothetical protein
MSTVNGWDATGAELSQAPSSGQAAGYITGSGGVPWSPEQQREHPGFVQIDQTPALPANPTADMYDLEEGAITVGEVAGIIAAAQGSFKAVTRPGQRWPGVYCSRDSVTDVVNVLVAANIQCPLGIADYDDDLAEAIAEVENASGPYPVVWRQYEDAGPYDLDVFSVEWLNNVSKKTDPPPIPSQGSVPEMLHISATAPAGHSWTGTRTFLYSINEVPEHIVDVQTEQAIAKTLPVIPVTWGQYLAWGGV